MIKKFFMLFVVILLCADVFASDEVYIKDCKFVQKSVKYYKKILEENPRDVCAYYNLYEAYYKKHKPQKELWALYAITIINPKDTDAYAMRANIYSLYGNMDNYYREYARAIKHIPNYAEAHDKVSSAYANILLDYDNALKHINLAINLSKEPDEYMYLSRGDIYMYMDRYEDAIKDFSKVIELNSSNYFAYDSRSKCYEKIGKTEEAKSDKEIEMRLRQIDKENNKKNIFEKIDLSLFLVKNKLFYTKMLF